MAAPTFIQEAETVWNTSGSKTTPSFSVAVGDVLVVLGICDDSDGITPHLATPTNTGTALTWTAQEIVLVAGFCEVCIWTAPATVAESITVTVTFTGAAQLCGINALTFRGSDGVGAAEKTNFETGSPTLNILTTQANSAIVVVNGDWVPIDGASRTWRTNAGALTEQSYSYSATRYTVYVGYHADAGAVATYAVGLSAPGAQKYSIAAVEIKGTAGAAAFIPRSRMRLYQNVMSQ